MIIRTLTVFERDAVRDFYLALGADDRRNRFCCALSDEIISKYVDGLDLARHTVLGAFDELAQLIGLAELAPGVEAGEMAFAVRPAMRCQSIGTKLIRRLLRYAQMSGIRKVFVIFLSDNTPMRKLAKRAGMSVETADGEGYASRELVAPNAEELSHWVIEEVVAQGAYLSILGIERWSSAVTQANSPTPRLRKTLDTLAV